jgi:hypothetical protein
LNTLTGFAIFITTNSARGKLDQKDSIKKASEELMSAIDNLNADTLPVFVVIFLFKAQRKKKKR